MKRKLIVSAAIIGLVMVSGVMVGPLMSHVEHPQYEVTWSADDLEIRQYAPQIIAEVEVEGNRDTAISDGFRLLANYIFGNNTVQQAIAMTAPVQQQANEKIAMTAPVQQQSFGNAWKISFVMPSTYTMATLPKPNNQNVKIKEIPARHYIVLQFSGTNSNENISKHEKQLLEYIESHKIQTVGAPQYAFYNPPWTLPFMRRNEIMVEIVPPH